MSPEIILILMVLISCYLIGSRISDAMSRSRRHRFKEIENMVEIGPLRVVHLRCSTCQKDLENGQMVVSRAGRMDHLDCVPEFKKEEPLEFTAKECSIHD